MKREEEMDRRKRIQNTRKMIEDWANELKNTDNSETIQPQIDAINAKLKQLGEDKANIDDEVNSLQQHKESLNRDKRGKTVLML